MPVEGTSEEAEVSGSLQEQGVRVSVVARLAWPIMVSMLSYTAMGVVDTLYVSRLGTAPLAAVGLAMTQVFLAQSFVLGLLGGLKVLIAQRVGAGTADAADGIGRLAWQGLWLAGLAGALVALLIPVSGAILSLMGASGGVVAHGEAFLRIQLLGAPLAFALQALGAPFHGRGETRVPMVATLLANGVNILLDPLFIFGGWGIPALGVGGAALATVLGLLVGVVYLAARLRGTLWAASASLDGAALGEIWRLGAPMGLRVLLEVGSFTLVAALLAQVGDAHLAAHVLVIRIISVSFLPGHAIGEAASVLTGQAVGARQPARAREAARLSMLLAVGVMAAMGLVFYLIPGVLLVPFHAPPEVATLGRSLLLIAAVFQIFDAVVMVGFGALNGAGDTRFTMAAGVGTAWLVKLPVGYALALAAGWGAPGAWWGLTAEIVLVALIALWRLRGEAWLAAAHPPPGLAGA